MKIITIANAKGGVGKSFVASNLAHSLNARGHKTLLVDLDQNVPSSKFWSLSNESTEFDGKVRISDNLLVATSSRLNPELDLTTVWPEAEFVIVDTSPGMEMSTVRAFGRSDLVLLVTSPEPASILGLLKTANAVLLANGNAGLGLVTNQTAGPVAAAKLATRLALKLGQALSSDFVFQTNIPFDHFVSDMAVRRQLISAVKPKSKVAKAISDLAETAINHVPDREQIVLLPQLRAQAPAPQKIAA